MVCDAIHGNVLRALKPVFITQPDMYVTVSKF